MPDSSETAARGSSRRDVLKKGGIVVGLAWTAPVVQSMLSPAFATGSEAGRGLCDRLIYIKWSLDCADKKSYWTTKETYNDKTCYNNLLFTLPKAGLVAPVPKVGPAYIKRQTKSWADIKDEGKITAVYDKYHDGVTITATEDCRIVAYQVKLGNGKGCAPYSAVLNKQPFPQFITAMGQGSRKRLSAVSLILCCND